MAGAVLGTVGSKIGALAGGTFGWTQATWSQIGWTAGSLLGNYLFSTGPKVKIEGTRLDDLKVTSSAYGIEIPSVYGSYRISGNVIWALDLQETKHEDRQESGKGGGGGSTTSTWYTYAGTWAVALCEGEIEGIDKIWFGSALVYNNGRYGGGLSSSQLAVYKGTSTQNVDWRIESNKPNTPAYRGLAYIVLSNIQLEDYGDTIPSVTCEVKRKTDEKLSTVVEDILLSGGVQSSEIDVSEAVNQDVLGYVISKNMSARSAVEPLLSAYDYYIVEDNFKMVLKKQQSTPTVNIPEDDLGANSDNSVEQMRTQEMDLMKSLTIRYPNPNASYQIGSQGIGRIETKATEERTLDLPIVLSDNEAKQIVEKQLFFNWMSRETFTFDLPSSYQNLIAGQIVTINYENIVQNIRLGQITLTEDGIVKCSGISFETTIYTSEAEGMSTDQEATLKAQFEYEGEVTGLQSIYIIEDTERTEDDNYFDFLTLEFTTGNNNGSSVGISNYEQGIFTLDTSDVDSLQNPIVVGDEYEILNNSLVTIFDTSSLSNTLINTETVYVAASGSNDVWRGCNIYSKSNVNNDFSLDMVVIQESAQGLLTDVLGDYATHKFDYTNDFTVKFYNEVPSSKTKEELIRGSNYCLVGKEILQFADVTDNIDGTHTISTLLRGRRGTEHYTGSHVANEIFVFLNSSAIGNIPKTINNNDIYGSISLSLNSIKEHGNFLYEGNNLKPFSPGYFRGHRNGVYIDLVWMRRSRYIAGYFRALPISEAVEKYELDVFDDSDTLIETITDIDIESYSYDTSAYFGANDEVRFKIYQISSIVQRGTPTELSVI